MRGLAQAALVLLLLLPGCITWDGPGAATIEVLITEDAGTTVLAQETVQVPQGASVMDALRAVATVDTAYGGGFVHAIDGRQSRYPDQRVDWFYHVNGALADVGAASFGLSGGEVVLWDYRPWNRTMHLPLVATGLDAWPAPAPGEPITPDQLRARLDASWFVRLQGDRLGILDAWGVTQHWVEPPWLLAHLDQVDGEPALVVATAGNDAALLHQLPDTGPRGTGVVLTPGGALGVPAR